MIRLSLGICALLLFCASAPAQTEPAPAQQPPAIAATAKDPYSPEQHAIMKLFGQGLYNEVIDETTIALDQKGTPDTFLLYWRGYARKKLSQFDGAREDLQGLGDYVGWPKFASASQLVKELDVLIQLRPAKEFEIRDGDKVVFRVYHDDDEELFRAVVDALPKGYKAASNLTGEQTTEIPVFLFDADKYQQFFKFYSLLKGAPPRFWWRVLSHSGAITISRADSNGNLLALAQMARNMSHEMTHQLMGRKVGVVDDFPNWFNEGAAQGGESAAAPDMSTQNDRRMQQLLQQDAILPLDQLVSNASFHDAVDQMKMGEQKGDAYAQGFNMTRYLGLLLKDKKLSDFLQTMRDKRSFSTALQEGTGLTPEEFYQSWLAAIKGENN